LLIHQRIEQRKRWLCQLHIKHGHDGWVSSTPSEDMMAESAAQRNGQQHKQVNDGCASSASSKEMMAAPAVYRVWKKWLCQQHLEHGHDG